MATSPAFESGLPPGLGPRLIAFCEQLRSEGLSVGTSEILDAFEALEHVPWTEREDFREALAATVAKSPEDRRVFELLFDRFFFRAAEAEALAQGIGESERHQGEGQIDLDELREAIRRAIIAGNDGEMSDLARLAIAAFGRRGRAPGVVGVDVQRIRRTLGLQTQSRPAPPASRPTAPRPRAINRFERHLRRELERGLIERTEKLPPSRPLAELDRALPTSPTQDLSSVHRAVTQLEARLATLGHEQRGRRKASAVDMRRTMRASLETGGVPLRLKLPAEAPSTAGDLRALRRLDLGHLGERLLPLGPARAPRLVPKAAQLRLHRADLRGDRRLRAERDFRSIADRSAARAGSPTSRATPTTAASGSSS